MLNAIINFVLWWTVPALIIWVLSLVYRKLRETSKTMSIPFAVIIMGVSWYAQSKIGWSVFWITVFFYLVYCWFQFARVKYEQSTGVVKYLWGALYLTAFLIGGPLDVIYQHTIAIWPLFWDRAEEMTLTQRLNRYLTQAWCYHTWRWWIAWALCKILNPWQVGGHCKGAA